MSKALLPTSAGPYEQALVAGGDDDLPVPIRQVMDPATAPAAFLPFLAVHEGVRFWFSDWTEARKRAVIADWTALAKLIGTRTAAQRFLDYVDAEIIHKVTYPVRKPAGRIAAGRYTSIQLPAFTAQFLVKTALSAAPFAICVGRTSVGRAAVRTIDREPLRRAMTALAMSKGAVTAYSINFAHRVPRTLDDGLDLSAGVTLGEFKDRVRL